MRVTKQNKKPGKTGYSVKRRQTTRESGYHSHKNATGGKYKKLETITYKGDLEIIFNFPKLIIKNKPSFKGFGFILDLKALLLSIQHQIIFLKDFIKHTSIQIGASVEIFGIQVNVMRNI